MAGPRNGLAPWLAALACAVSLHLLALQNSSADPPVARAKELQPSQRVIPMALLVGQPKPLDTTGQSGPQASPTVEVAAKPLSTPQPTPPTPGPSRPAPDSLPSSDAFSTQSASSADAAPGPISPEPAVEGLGEESPTTTPTPAALKALPIYTTELPAAFTQALRVRRMDPVLTRGEPRSPAEGQGELRFERSAPGAYSLNLSLQWGPKGQMEMHSQGRLGVAGLEPERFTDRRRGRSRTAANFDRANQQARFSAGAAPVALAAAAQDRLTWMVQLPAVIRADPSLRRTGAMVWLQVVGARGGSQIWQFESLGPETLRLPDGSIVDNAWRWRRVAEQPYDLQVDAWLAEPPLSAQAQAASHMPALVRLTPVPGGAALEFWPVEAAVAERPSKREP